MTISKSFQVGFEIYLPYIINAWYTRTIFSWAIAAETPLFSVFGCFNISFDCRYQCVDKFLGWLIGLLIGWLWSSSKHHFCMCWVLQLFCCNCWFETNCCNFFSRLIIYKDFFFKFKIINTPCEWIYTQQISYDKCINRKEVNIRPWIWNCC